MKRNMGSVLVLYPMPLAVIGAMVDGKPNWLLAGHMGIMGHDHVMVSLAQAHYTNRGIRESGRLSINLVDEAMLARADRAGCVSGNRVDKSGLFDFEMHDGVPIVAHAPVAMACSVQDLYPTPGFENFICTIDSTYAEERVLNPQGKLDYGAFHPVLFEMPTYAYLKAGEVLGPCTTFAKQDAQG